MNMRNVRQQLVEYSHLIYDKGWVANHEGNLTCRIGANRWAATPTSFSKRDVGERDLIDVDDERNVLRGIRRPFSEFVMHLSAYRSRDDVKAVIHAHPPHATALSVVGRGLERPFIAESVVSIGPTVPLIPYATPGAKSQLDALAEAFLRYDVVILENHGVLSAGATLEQAFLRLEYVEHLASILTKAGQLGNPRFLSWDEIQPLLDGRKRAGLGPEARGMTRQEAYGHLAST